MKLIIIFSMMFICHSVFAKNISLESLKAQAFKNNFGLNAARNEVLRQKEKEKETSSRFMPKVGIELGQEKIESKDTKEAEDIKALYLDLNLFNGFKDQLHSQRHKLSSVKAKSRLKQSSFELSLTVEKMYYTSLYLSKKLKVVQSALKRNQEHLGFIDRRLSSGLVTETDLLEFKLKRSKLKSKEEFLKLRVEEVNEQLFRSSGFNNPKNHNIEGSLPHFMILNSLEEISGELRAHNQEIQRSKLEIEQIAYEAKEADSSWYPRVDLKVKHGYLSEEEIGVDNSSVSSSIAVMARWEIFSGFKTQYSKNSVAFKKIKEQYSLRQKELDFSLILARYYKRLITLQKRISREEQNERIAKSFYKKTVKEYRKGIKDSGALSGAGDELTEIEEKVYELKSSYIEAKIALEQACGKSLRFKIVKH